MAEVRLNHPTDDELRALSVGQLRDEELARVSAHLVDCPECCGRIDKLDAEDTLLSRLQQRAARREEALVTPTQRRSAVHALRLGKEDRAAAPVFLPAPKQVGDYDILAEVGRGGMGVVYKARHRSLHRLAAVKMVLAGEFASPTQQLRFRLEAELAARVQHPNIVQLYEIGTHDSRPFLAMEWVEGGSLADRLDGKPCPPGESAELVETLARAIHVAHGQGVVHRDLKPANILLAVEGEGWRVEGGRRLRDALHPPPSTLHPKITDFGLAQPTDDAQTLTQSGLLVGTPGYMAPEQAAGKRALVGPATDIYALGVVLYQLLTGQLPFPGDSTLEVLRAVTNDEPLRPRRLQPRLPRDLEAITLLCLEKEPSRRYDSALALAEDLQRFQEGRQVRARPVTAVARSVRACRRRPLVTLLLALLTASLFGGLAGVTWKWLEANAQRRQADAEKQAAQYQTYRARIAATVAALSAHDVEDAARQLDAAPEELRDWEWRHLHSRLDDSFSVMPLPSQEAGFLFDAPDGLRAWAWSSAGLRLKDLETGAEKALPVGGYGHVVNIIQNRHGLRVAAWVGNTTIDLLDETGRAVCRVEMPEAKGPGPVYLSPDGTQLVCIRVDGDRFRPVVFDATSGKQTVVCEGHQGGIPVCAFSPDGTRLVSGGEDRTARLWDAATGALLATCQGHTSKILDVSFRPDAARLVTTSSDGTVRQWDAATGHEVEAPYDRHSGEVAAAVYSPDGQWVASTGTDRAIRVWQASGRHDVAVLHGHTGAVLKLAFAPDGRRLASISDDNAFGWPKDDTVRVWEVDFEVTLPVLRGHTSYVYPVAFSPDGHWIASGGWDRTVRLWDAATGEPCATLPHAGSVWGLAYDPDGSWLVSGAAGENRLRIWDVGTARVRREIQVPGISAPLVTVSPDGRRGAATAYSRPQNNEQHLHVFDLASGERLFSAEGQALAYSPDGRWLAARAADDRTVLLLDAQTHETAGRFEGHEKVVYSATFSPDSRYLASCSKDRTVRLWQIYPRSPASASDEGKNGPEPKCRVLRGHTDDVFAAAFHPDGTRLATAGRDRAIWLWDLARGEEVARLQGHTSYVWSLAWSPDGTTLASGSGDFTVRLWDTAPLKIRYQARREAAALRPEAERLVEKLWRQKNNADEVAEAIRADLALSEPLRHGALRAVLRRTLPPEAAPGNPHGRP